MKYYYVLFFASVFSLSSLSYGQTDLDRDVEDQDIRALKEWIQTKRQISLKEIGGDLSLSGELRTEYQTAWETYNGKQIRGIGEGKIPNQGFDVEFNLMLDYRTDRSWASIKLEFDNNAGVFNGTFDRLSLERAYWGIRAVEGDVYTFDIEIGRRFLANVFDSRIQFGSNFDGILFRYDHSFEKVGDFYIHAGPFVVNELKNHFSYVGEVGLLNIGGTGFQTKLSCIAWDTKHYPIDFIDNRFRFIIGQFTPAYRFKIEKIKKICLLYSAVLYNFAAKRLPVSDNKRANWGGYVGISIGQLLKQWDWALDLNYQAVSAQAVPDFDVSGIGAGNANRSGFYTKLVRPLEGGFNKEKEPVPTPSTPETAGGPGNYQGFAFRFDLLLTDKLDMQHIFLISKTLDSDIGPKRTFQMYEMEFIYSW